MRSRRQYVSVQTLRYLMAEFENKSFNESENGVRRLSWHTFTQYDERLAGDLSVNSVLWWVDSKSHENQPQEHRISNT